MSSEIIDQMQDVKSQMDQFRLYLQIQQGRADDYKSQVDKKARNLSQTQQLTSPFRTSKAIDKSRTTPRKPALKKNFYTPINVSAVSVTPKTKKNDVLSNILSTDDSSDEEIDLILKEVRKGSGSPSPFKKYHFSSDSKASLSKYSVSNSPSDKSSKKESEISSDDSTEISKNEITFSDQSSDSSDSNSFQVHSSRPDKKVKSRYHDGSSSKHSNKAKILHSMKLVDEVMSESDKKKKKLTKFKLKISKPFAVPYSGSYEEGEVYKIENDESVRNSTDTDSDVDEFNNFVPPIADEFDGNKSLNEKTQGSENTTQSKNSEKSKSDVDVIKVNDLPDVEIPRVDLNFLKEDENEAKSDTEESDKESINDLFDKVQQICTILDNEEESD